MSLRSSTYRTSCIEEKARLPSQRRFGLTLPRIRGGKVMSSRSSELEFKINHPIYMLKNGFVIPIHKQNRQLFDSRSPARSSISSPFYFTRDVNGIGVRRGV